MVRRAEPPEVGRSAVDQQLVSARELRLDERFTEASIALDRALTLSPTEEHARLINAERARLAYYLGEFEQGLRIAREVLIRGPDLAAARAGLAASANLMALNRAHEALAAVLGAQLLFRVTRARADDVADGLIQLTHVHAHMGNHRIAVETGRVASRLTNTDPNADRLRGRALCALGFALTCSGDEEALEVLLDAERAERTRAAALWHWAQFCIGAFLRDRGYAQPAVIWLSRSGVAIRHERAWFAIRGGDVSGAGEWVTPPIRADERPFARTVLAALRTARGRPGAERVAIKAATEFAHLGMHHWSWGARWIAAASPELNARRRASFVGDLVAELAERSAMHWGFFDPVSAMRALTSIPRQGMPHHAQRLVVHLSTWSSPPQYEDGALLGVLRFVKADGLSTLADAGLTPTELRALIVALELWLEHGEASRSAMASRLHARESSVRSLIGDIRSKLGIRGRRGVEPLVAWLAARDVLTPSTAMQVIRRLTR